MSNLQWTKEQPNGAGYYWAKDEANRPEIVEVMWSDYKGKFVALMIADHEDSYDLDDWDEWAGPLNPPRATL